MRSVAPAAAGDLVKLVDAAGNVICITYDAMHCPLTVKVASGSYQSVTQQAYYIYDFATLSGTAMQNVR